MEGEGRKRAGEPDTLPRKKYPLTHFLLHLTAMPASRGLRAWPDLPQSVGHGVGPREVAVGYFREGQSPPWSPNAIRHNS